VACGVEAQDGATTVGAVEPDTSTTAPKVPCGDEGGSTAGGAIGGDEAPGCSPDPSPDPQVTTTTEDEPVETTTTIDEGGGDEQAYVDALTSQLRDDDTFGDLSADQATCIAGGWVDALGADDLSAAGIDPDDLVSGDIREDLGDVLDEGTATEMISALGDCGVDVDQLLADQLRSGGSVPADKVDCIIGALPDGYVEQLLATSLSGGRDALDADPTLKEPLIDAAKSCR